MNRIEQKLFRFSPDKYGVSGIEIKSIQVECSACGQRFTFNAARKHLGRNRATGKEMRYWENVDPRSLGECPKTNSGVHAIS